MVSELLGTGGIDRRLAVAGGLSGIAGLAMSDSAKAQAAFPTRPLSIMTPVNPGGATDLIARVMRIVIAQEKLSPRPIEVMNRGGAGGSIALAELVSRRHGDPHIILCAGAGILGSTVAQNSPFRITDTEPLARLLVDSLMVAVPRASNFRDMGEFIAAFRREPESISWCGGSAGSSDHILVGLIAEACGVPVERIRYIAYSGGGAASAALLGGQVSVGVASYGEWRGLAESGGIRPLGLSAPERFGAGNIPTFREGGLDLDFLDWRGLFAPPGQKPEHLAWWNTMIDRMQASPSWHAFLLKNGWVDGYVPGERFKSLLITEQRRFSDVLARLGIGGTSGGYSQVGPYAVPAMVGAAGAVAAAAAVAERVMAKDRPVGPAGGEDDDEGGGPLPLWSRLGLGVGLVAAYVTALSFTGFLIATPPFIFGLCVVMRSKTRIWDAVMAVALTLAVWMLFSKVLYVELP